MTDRNKHSAIHTENFTRNHNNVVIVVVVGVFVVVLVVVVVEVILFHYKLLDVLY